MAKLDNEMKVIIQGENKTEKAFQEVKQASQDAANSIGGKFEQLSKKMSTLTKSIATGLIGVFSITRLIQFGKETIKLGADSVETANLFAISFGDMTKDMDKFGKKLQETSGISDQLFRDQSARMNNLFRTLGMSTEKSFMMTKDLMERSLDISSLFNVDREEILDKMRAGLVGMIKPLRQFGINLEVAQVEAYAYASGIAEVGKQLTQSQKTQARYEMIMNSSKIAQGDMARTINTVGNATRRLSDMWQQFQTMLGRLAIPTFSALLKIAIPMVQVLQMMVGTISEIGRGFKWLSDTIPGFKYLKDVINVLLISFGTYLVYTKLIKNETLVAIFTTKLWSGANITLAGTMAMLNKIMSSLYFKILLLVGAVYIIYKALSFWKRGQDGVNKSTSQSAASAGELSSNIDDVSDSLKGMSKQQKTLTPLDEIVNIGEMDKAGELLDLDSFAGIENLLDTGQLNEFTNSLLDMDGVFSYVWDRAYKSGQDFYRLIDSGQLNWKNYARGIDIIYSDYILPAFSSINNFAGKIGSKLASWIIKISPFELIRDLLKATWDWSYKIGQAIGKWLPASVLNGINDMYNKFKEIYNWFDKMFNKKNDKLDAILKGNFSLDAGKFGGSSGGGRGFATGGNPPVGRVSIVGERGPELFIPNTRGMVVSNDDIKSMINTQGNGNDTATILSAINSLAGNKEVALNVDGRQLAKVVYNPIENEGNRNGRNVTVRSVV